MVEKMKPSIDGRVFAVDFDGTCVDHVYPEIGREVPKAVESLKWLQEHGAKIILWTMRSGDELEQAKVWFEVRGIRLYGINTNPTQTSWTRSPKAYAHDYIDDAALGCPLMFGIFGMRPIVDWRSVMEMIRERYDF